MPKIIKKEFLQPTVVRITIIDSRLGKHALPGEFAILRAKEGAERIPLTIYNVDSDKVSFIYQIVGASTYALSLLNEGDEILDVCGPLGKATDIYGIKKAIVVGGGVGSAIAFPIAKALKKQGSNVTTILGFRSKNLIILEDDFKNVSDRCFITTDDGSNGVKGLVTDILKELIEKEDYDCVYAIGPLIMMKYVSLTTKEKNIKTIVSMNPIMIDGTGMCGCCRLTVDGKVKFACVDGPDFDGHKVDFEETMKRNTAYKEIEKEKYDEIREKNCNLFKGVKK